MKLVTNKYLISLLLGSQLAVGRGETINDDEDNLRGLQGKNLFKDFPSNVPPLVSAKFKERFMLKNNARPQFQDVKGKSFMIGDETIPFGDEDLIPVKDIFAPGATYSFNGEIQTELPKPSVFTSIKDESVTVTKGPTGKLVSASKKTGNGKSIDLLPLQAGSEVFATVSSDDINLFKLNRKFKYGEADIFPPPSLPSDGGGRTRNLVNLHKSIADEKLDEALFPSNEHRSLQQCTEFEVIEVAIAYESTFCNDYGNNEIAATSAVVSIVNAASQFYQQPGLCKSVKISYLEGYCSGTGIPDPYLNVMAATSVCGGGSSLLDRFRQFWTANRGTVPRDVAHLFHGKNLGNTIGCAYLDVLCRKDAGYGVNHITFSPNQNLQNILFAHELGHNAGSNHDCSSCNFIMRPSICSSCTTFSGSSVNQIQSHVDSVNCIDVENPPTGCQSDDECDDGDECTNDECDSTSGLCSSTYDDTISGCELCNSENNPLICDSGDDCIESNCNQVTGECVTSPKNCDDSDPCTNDTCENGQCSNVLDTTIPGCDPTGPVCGEFFDNCSSDPCCAGFFCWEFFPICLR